MDRKSHRKVAFLLGTLVGFEGFAGQNNRLISIFLAFYILFLRFPAKNK
jgi:hypothetical protein